MVESRLEEEEEKVESKLEEEKVKQAGKLARIVSRMADYALYKVTKLMSEAAGKELTPDEALRFLDQHPELLSFELLDEAISSDFKIKLLVNSALRIAGAIVKRNNGWVSELHEKGVTLFLEMLKFRRDLYELLKDKHNLVEFLFNYIMYKLGV